jgi:hypothetical protein
VDYDARTVSFHLQTFNLTIPSKPIYSAIKTAIRETIRNRKDLTEITSIDKKTYYVLSCFYAEDLGVPENSLYFPITVALQTEIKKRG